MILLKMTLKNQIASEVAELVSDNFLDMNLTGHCRQKMVMQQVRQILLEINDDNDFVVAYFSLFYIIASTIELILKLFSHCQVNIEIRSSQQIYSLAIGDNTGNIDNMRYLFDKVQTTRKLVQNISNKKYTSLYLKTPTYSADNDVATPQSVVTFKQVQINGLHTQQT